MDLERKRILVIGLGKTGEALCRFLLEKGANVKVSEKRSFQDLQDKVKFWTKQGVAVETGGHSLKSFLETDLIVTSPGVPYIPELIQARDRGIKTIAEIELAFHFLEGTIVGITGSNGKSTTATLTYNLLRYGGKNAFLAGNIDTPLISFTRDSRQDHIYVTELSSFQLEHTEKFRVSVAVFLNITPDHLDWHGSFDAYFAAKKKLIDSLPASGTAILNKDDSLVWSLAETAPRVYGFSRNSEVEKGCFIREDWIICADRERERLIPVSDIPLFGIHNLDNIMASFLVGHLFSIPSAEMRKSVKSFRGLEHRLEKVATIDKVDFYNDSKATNVGAALQSIQSFDRPVILILGGRDKGGDFAVLRNPVGKKVKRVLLIGEAKEKIGKALDGASPMTGVQSMREAVEQSFASAQPGDVVLLAPACTSFDMYTNFEERGRAFKQEVFRLAETRPQRKE